MLRRLLAPLLFLSLLVGPAGATWSIVFVNRRTGEVAIGSATCLPRTNLLKGLPVVVVEKGAGAIQAASGGEAGLVIIYDELMKGEEPATILQLVKQNDPRPQQRQIGIVGMTGSPVTFTGSGAGAAKGGVAGEQGDLAWAIQGNVLTGANVWLAARDALLQTPGDTTQKLMAAMEAAYSMGGDGRCSCSLARPASCGSPPPSFTKSAHCGFMVVARHGDTDATCTTGDECATGSYFLKLNVKGNNAKESDPDPVLQLRVKYDEWRAKKIGRPDGLLSTVDAVQSLPADGVTQRTVTIRLVDIEGTPLTFGGASVTVTTASGAPSLTTVGPVQDHGDGTYSFSLTAGLATGTDTFQIVAHDGSSRKATLSPDLVVRSDPPLPLHVGYDQVSAMASPRVPFVLNAPGGAGRPYVILASLAGTQPGSPLGDFLLPLNAPLVSVLRGGVDEARLPGTLGVLSDAGRAEAAFVSGPLLLGSLIGRRIDWAAVVQGRAGASVVGPVGFDVVP